MHKFYHHARRSVIFVLLLVVDFHFSKDLDVRLRNLDLIGGQDKLVVELGGQTSNVDNDMFNPTYQKAIKVHFTLKLYTLHTYITILTS